MHNVGELIIYSTHGLCRIEEICEKTYSEVTKTYYVLQPLNNTKLKINIPTNSDKLNLIDLVEKDEAEEIIESFKFNGIEWIEKNIHRTQFYTEIIKNGERREIANIINTMMRKKHETESNGKKFPSQDSKFLISLQNILFSELAISLNTNSEVISNQVINNLAIRA